LFIFILISILFFIPPQRTGFVTQVESAPRAFIGFLFASIGICFLAILLAKRGRPRQQLLAAWQDHGPELYKRVKTESELGERHHLDYNGIKKI